MATSTVIHRPYPKVGEIFELGLDGDAVNNHVIAMVRRVGDPRGWAHNGPLVTGRAIRPHKLVELRPTLTFDEVLAELARYGKIPEGQWASAFKVTYPKTDGHGPIGIADASWWAPDGRINFPYIGRGGDLGFHRASGSFGANWRWIVGV